MSSQLDPLLIALQSPDLEARRDAALAFTVLRPDVLRSLLDLLTSGTACRLAGDDDRVGSELAYAIGRTAYPEVAAPGLLLAIGSPDPVVRRDAAAALRLLGPGDWSADAAAALSGLLGTDAEPDVRRDAAVALGSFGPTAVEPLLAALEDPADGVKAAAVRSLGRIGERPPDAATGRRITARLGRLAKLPGAVGIHASTARAAVGSDRAREKTVAGLLARMADPGSDADTRLELVLAVKRLADRPAFVAPVVPVLADPSPLVRAEAALILRNIGDPAGVGPLARAAVDDVDARVREAAVEALRAVGPAAGPVLPAVTAALADADARVRHQAVLLAQTLGPAATALKPDLAERVRDANPAVRLQAAFALDAVAADDPTTARAVTAALDDPFVEVRLVAGSVLAGRPDAHLFVPAVFDLARGTDDPWAERAEVFEVRAELLGLLRSSWPKPAMALVGLLADPDYRDAAAVVLCRPDVRAGHDSAIVESLIVRLADPDIPDAEVEAVVIVAEAIGRAGVPALRTIAADRRRSYATRLRAELTAERFDPVGGAVAWPPSTAARLARDARRWTGGSSTEVLDGPPEGGQAPNPKRTGTARTGGVAGERSQHSEQRPIRPDEVATAAAEVATLQSAVVARIQQLLDDLAGRRAESPEGDKQVAAGVYDLARRSGVQLMAGDTPAHVIWANRTYQARTTDSSRVFLMSSAGFPVLTARGRERPSPRVDDVDTVRRSNRRPGPGGPE